MSRTLSVCTLAGGREAHLANLVRSLAHQTRRPDELVIAHLQPQPYRDLPQAPFAIRQVPAYQPAMALARARNRCAGAARGDVLVFLDVDCVAAPDMLAGYLAALRPGLCAMGETRYLGGADDAGRRDFARLWSAAERHPARAFPDPDPDPALCLDDHGEFWSLSFALHRETFLTCGGFDESFVGYGGEDTDFAMALRDADVQLAFVPGARAVHQWHEVEKPPLRHLSSIVRNANLFRAKHGRWCMDYWLGQLEDAGFIRTAECDSFVEILREPTAAERRAARQGPEVRFS